MAEEKKPAAAAKAEKPKAEKAEKKTHDSRETVKKPTWSIQRCRKIARRFDSLDQWRVGAPSSFKSASAHGWVDQIVQAVWNAPAPMKKAA